MGVKTNDLGTFTSDVKHLYDDGEKKQGNDLGLRGEYIIGFLMHYTGSIAITTNFRINNNERDPHNNYFMPKLN